MLHEWMQITEEVDTKPNVRQIDSLNQYRLLTKLSAVYYVHSISKCNNRTFWTWHCFFWNIRLKLNSRQLHISLKKSELHTGYHVTFYLFIICRRMLKIYNFFFFCIFLSFLHILMLSCNCCFPVFIIIFSQSLEKWCRMVSLWIQQIKDSNINTLSCSQM